jgi:glutamine amidotransferase
VTRIAIVDYGLGNLLNLERALDMAGGVPDVTSDPVRLQTADAIVLPGVGAFGEGMRNLERRGLAGTIRRVAMAGKPTLGVCLGMQLLMDESEEHGRWAGLGLIPGRVVRLEAPPGQRVKVPQVGWNSINAACHSPGGWSGTLLDGVAPGAFVYFVHSYCVQTAKPETTLAETDYAATRFCSVVVHNNVAGCQFHPELSGETGVTLLRNFVDSASN